MVTDVEKRLAEYRAKKSSTSPTPTILPSKPHYTETIALLTDKQCSEIGETVAKPFMTCESPHQTEPIPSTSSTSTNKSICSVTSTSRLSFYITALKYVLWVLLMVLFVEVEFGAIFFICSIFYLIYTNLRTGPKPKGEISAYSVFNPNCEAIDGTLTAEQFERELKFGPKSVR